MFGKTKKRGRSKRGEQPEKLTVIQDRVSVKLSFDEPVCERALYRAGYYPLITNQPAEQLSLEHAMIAHKNQYKCEHLNRRDAHSPRTEYLLTAFRCVVRGQIFLDDGRIHGSVSELTPTQKDIIAILKIPLRCSTYGYLFDAS